MIQEEKKKMNKISSDEIPQFNIRSITSKFSHMRTVNVHK